MDIVKFGTLATVVITLGFTEAFILDTAYSFFLRTFANAFRSYAETRAPLRECIKYPKYNELLSLTNKNNCLSLNKVFPQVYDLSLQDMACGVDVTKKLSVIYENITANPSQCVCTGQNHKQPYREGFLGLLDEHNRCVTADKSGSYEALYKAVYEDQHSPCMTHHRGWAMAYSVTDNECLAEILYHLAVTFQNHRDPCTCRFVPVASTSMTSTLSTTTTTLPTTSETTTTSTTVAIKINYQRLNVCDSVQTVQKIAAGTASSNVNAPVCPQTGKHESPEALVLSVCNVTTPATWTAGPNVLSVCSKLLAFTPIARFTNGHHPSLGGISGVFLGCLAGNHGFKMAVQECGQAPSIIHPEIGRLISPADFYVIN